MRLDISLFRGNRMLPSKLATWCKGEETLWYINTAVRQTDEEKSRKLHPRANFQLLTYHFLFFLKLDKHEGLWGQDTTESDSEVALNICLRVWRQVCLRTTLTSLSCLDWTFEFSQQCFAVAQFLVVFIGENKCGSSPSKEVFKALHGRNLNWVQDVW